MLPTTNKRILSIADAFDELHALVTSEPGLAPFVSAIEQLRIVGEQARAGHPIQMTVARPHAQIPTLEIAKRIRAIVDHVPGPADDEEQAASDVIAIMLANLSRAIVGALFVGYPDLMRS